MSVETKCWIYKKWRHLFRLKFMFRLQIADGDTMAARCPKYSLDKCEEKICWNWLADYAVVDCALSALIFMLFHPHNDFAAPLMG